jgi:glycine cleavage system transcriptional repressor
MGEVGQMTIIYEMPKGLTTDALEKELAALPEMEEIRFRANKIDYRTLYGPTSRITHRIILSGGDRPGLVAKITNVLDKHGANIVRLNSEKVGGASGDQYISRFAISLREERAPACLAEIVKWAGELKLTFRYETA